MLNKSGIRELPPPSACNPAGGPVVVEWLVGWG